MINSINSTADKELVGVLLDDALAMGYVVSVWDGEEWALERSDDKNKIMQEMGGVDEERLYFYQRGNQKPTGWVFLVYGNSKGELIADHSDNPAMEELLKRANEVADRQMEEA